MICRPVFAAYCCFNSSQVGWKHAWSTLDLLWHFQFQFLIGRLETRKGDVYIFAVSGFQFLIGRLETEIESVIPSSLFCFNSSQVGWKRCQGWPPSDDLLQVSIPHRQAGNVTVELVYSNDHLFQFLIGRLETWGKENLLPHCIVSIPHRQAGNLPLFPKVCYSFSQFQFLIGRLETPSWPA